MKRSRFALVTGAGGAIGQALCTEFRRSGYRVIGLDLSEDTIDADFPLACDLAELAQENTYRERKAKEISDLLAHNPLQVLINNAAVQYTAPFEELDSNLWQECLATNVIAPALLVRLLLGKLESVRGTVINIGSIHATLTKPGFSSYATSKAALIGLTRSLAVELSSRIRVAAICPAAIDTEMLRRGFEFDEDRLLELASFHPTNCIGTPTDVARAAVALCEMPGRFISGCILNLDGGISSRLHDPV